MAAAMFSASAWSFMSCWWALLPSVANRQKNSTRKSPALKRAHPRQVDDQIPRELERICLKALSKRSSERYLTANDMANDLRQFLSQTSKNEIGDVPARPKSAD